MSTRVVLLVCFALLAGCKWFGKDSDPPVGQEPPPPPPAVVAPGITAQPGGVSAVSGQTATFSVTASGTGPFAYQWRRDGVDIAGATASSFTTSATTMADDGASYTVVITNSAGSVTSGAAVLTVNLPAGTTSSIEVSQTTAFLKAVGESVKLDAHPVDAQGAPIAGSVTWTSSNPDCIGVDATGRITANKIGSALLFAEANGVKSMPIFVLAAEPMPGALVVDDAQVVAIGAADASEKYDVTVSGVATAPAVGTVVLGSGDAKVGGKVVSSRAEAGNQVLTLQIVPLPQLLARYDIQWDIDLGAYPQEDLNFQQTFSKSSRPMKAMAAAQEPEEFHRFECGGEYGAGTITPSITLQPRFSTSRLEIESARDDPRQSPGYSKMALVGSASLVGSAGVKVSAGFGGEAFCYAQNRIDIPVGGFVSFIIMPSIRGGVRFDLDARVEVASAELKAEGTLGVQQTLGMECTYNNCRPLNQIDLIDDFKLTNTVPSFDQMHVEGSAHLYAYVALDVKLGLGLIDAEVVEGKVGPKLSFDFAFPENQAALPDPASNYKLELAGSIEPGDGIQSAIKKLIDDDSVRLDFGIPFSRPWASSPKGQFSVSSNNVSFGTPVDFLVHLDQPLTFPLVGENGATGYNVKSIQLWRKKEGEPKFTIWRTLPVTKDQFTFQDEWTPTEADVGNYQFAAFTETIPPVPALEVTDDSVRHVHVRGAGWAGNVTFTMRGSKTETRHEVGPDGQSTITTTWTDSASGGFQLETMPDAQGLGFMDVAQGSGTYSTSTVQHTDANYRSNGCDVVATETQEEIQTGSLNKLPGSFALLSMTGPDTYELMIPYLTGTTSGTIHIQGSDTQSGGPGCHDSQPANTTTPVSGSASTSILTVRGTISGNGHTARGSATVTVPGFLNNEYSVEWNLTQ